MPGGAPTASPTFQMTRHAHPAALFVLAATLLAGCATPSPDALPGPKPPPNWQAPLPHQGSLTDLSQWWRAQGDPLLVELIDAAQAEAPTVASARSKIEQARATRVAAGAALGPTLNATVNAQREPLQTVVVPNQPPPSIISTTVTGQVQASWEVDLFGANRAARDAAQARLDGARAGWHDARVSVAAEVANQYVSLRTCQRLLAVSTADAASRNETARLTELAAQAGFQPPATAALARAAAADARGRAAQQRALCEIDVKALVQLTGMSEPDLRQKLAPVRAVPEDFAPITIASVPAATLAQRPDVLAAERDVAAASADLGSQQAQRYPRLTLNGSVGFISFRSGGTSFNSGTWSIGPVTLALPLYDGGQQTANIASAQARYEEAAALYRAKARQAVREVEEALVNLASTAERTGDAQIAADGYRVSFEATEAKYQRGLASLVDLEDARRTALSSQTNAVNLQRERMAAWIALYRAAGGGWTPATPDATGTPTTAAPPT